MNTFDTGRKLQQLLEDNPGVIAAWVDYSVNPPTLEILAAHPPNSRRARNAAPREALDVIPPPPLNGLTTRITYNDPIRDLRLPLPIAEASNRHQKCQNEPISLGTQIQPAGAPWVGTAGLPVKWIGPDGDPHWGILSNAHVMLPDHPRSHHPQCQPTDRRSAIAKLYDVSYPSPDEPNLIDAAIADAKVDRLHTIANNILEIGTPAPELTNAYPDLHVTKAGRTTGVTTATCKAIGAAVKVSYGDFTATFIDQDIFESTGSLFSAPGDSGSIILGDVSHAPCSLLFAGGGRLTIGNPMRHVVQRFDLQFPFN